MVVIKGLLFEMGIKWLISLSALLLLLSSSPLSAQEALLKATLLILPFEVNSPAQGEALGKAIMEGMRSEFAKRGDIDLLEEAVTEKGDLKAIARQVGAAFLIYGSVTELGGNYSIDARLLNSIEDHPTQPSYAIAQGREGLSAALAKLSEELGRQIMDSWSRTSEDKKVALLEKRRPTKPKKALPVVKERPTAAKEDAVKVALLPFKVNSPTDSEEIRRRLWEALSTYLTKGDQVVIVGKDIAKGLLKDADSLDLSEDVVRKLAKEAGADYLVFGSLTLLGESVSLDSSIFHNLPEEPFSVSKVYVEGRGKEALDTKVEELAFELKRRVLKGKIIVTPLEEGPKVTVLPKEKPKPPAPAPKAEEPKTVAPAPVKEATPKEKKPAEGLGFKAIIKKGTPINISSRRLEADNKARTVTFKGEVVAKKDDMTINADVMVASYDSGGRDITQIVAEGKVKIVQGDRIATSGRAVFYNEEQKLVLTKDPKVWQGKNVVGGEVITVFMAEDRMVVEGGDRHRVSATIFPEEVK